MKILLLNQDWFAKEFRDAGHEVVSYGMASHLDVMQEHLMVKLDEVLSALPLGFTPDLIVAHDNSSPFSICGLDSSPIPSLFYSVDAHHHACWHKYVAHMFDATFIAHRDYASPFREVGIEPVWFPLWASRSVQPCPAKEHGAVFVGTLDPELNPDRVAFFEALRKKVPVLCCTGAWWDIFPKSEIVINQTVKGDLNFRVFEAMMSGAMLLTERTENGLLELFQDGQHLVTYAKGDVDEAAERVHYYLNHPDECRQIAAQGRNEIMSRHQAVHRAEVMLGAVQGLERRSARMRHFGALVNFSCIGKLLRDLDASSSLLALAEALHVTQSALEKRESINFEIACHAIRSIEYFEGFVNSGRGRELLYRLQEAYPEEAVLKIAAIRSYLNTGRMDEAKSLAGQLVPPGEEENLFKRSEEVVQTILEPHSS